MTRAELDKAINAIAERCWGENYQHILDSDKNTTSHLKMLTLAIFMNDLDQAEEDVGPHVKIIREALVGLRDHGMIILN